VFICVDPWLICFSTGASSFPDSRQDYDYGRFAWIMDPEGNKIELWQQEKKN
jgi:predicted enzyme related to lactoylglutathione lyase